MKTTNNKPFYKKWWGIMLTILFFPIAIPIIIAKYTNWSKGLKITTIIAFYFLLFAYIMNEGGKIQQERENFCNEQLTNTGAENILMQQKYDLIGTFTKGEKYFDFSCTGTRGKFLFSVTENFSKINTQQDQDEQNNKQEEILQNEEKQEENENGQDNQPSIEEQKEENNKQEEILQNQEHQQDNKVLQENKPSIENQKEEKNNEEEKTKNIETPAQKKQKLSIQQLKENTNITIENQQEYSTKIEQLRSDCLDIAHKHKNFSLFFTDYNPHKNSNITLHGGVLDIKKGLEIEKKIGDFTCFYTDSNNNPTLERKNLSIYFYDGIFTELEYISEVFENPKKTATVLSISDGDTIKVQSEGTTQTIRIIGIDTPESTTTRFGYAECYGQEASDFLKKHLPSQSNIEISYHGGDKYNRDLAEIFYNNENISEIMIKNGYAWVYKKGIQPNNFETLLQLENQAKKQKIGLWAENTCNGERKKIEKPKPTQTTTKSVNTKNTSSHGGKGNSEPFQKEFNTPNCHIKGNINKKGEKIYHTPSGKFYKKTEPEACFKTEQEAINAGFRPSKV